MKHKVEAILLVSEHIVEGAVYRNVFDEDERAVLFPGRVQVEDLLGFGFRADTGCDMIAFLGFTGM